MAIDKTMILNKALTLVGAAKISSINEDSNNALVMRNVYEVSLRSILSECNWNFAKKRVNLTVSADTFDWYDTGEGVVYVRPADMIKPIRVNVVGAKWREVQDYILSDTSGLGMEYLFYLDNPVKYSPLFVDALVDKLASDVAYLIVNSATLGERYLTKYEKLSLPKATASNSQAGIQQATNDDAWENAKYFDGQPDS